MPPFFFSNYCQQKELDVLFASHSNRLERYKNLQLEHKIVLKQLKTFESLRYCALISNKRENISINGNKMFSHWNIYYTLIFPLPLTGIISLHNTYTYNLFNTHIFSDEETKKCDADQSRASPRSLQREDSDSVWNELQYFKKGYEKLTHERLVYIAFLKRSRLALDKVKCLSCQALARPAYHRIEF